MRLFLPAVLTLAVTLSVLSGCTSATRRPPLPANAPLSKASNLPESNTQPEVFPLKADDVFTRLRAGDTIRVRLWGDVTITGEYTVNADGTLVLPLLGGISAKGSSREELEASIAKRLEQYYSKPRLEVSLVSYGPRTAYVMGGAESPGSVVLGFGENLLTLLGKAGGLEIRENERRQSLGIPQEARILRGNSIALIDLRNLLDGRAPESNLAILPDDVVYIPRESTQSVHVMGEVNRQGLVGLGPQMDVTQAISLAAGFSDDANTAKVRVLRRWWAEDAEMIEIDYKALLKGESNAPILLQDQDIVFVPRLGIATFNYYLRQVTPSLATMTAGP